MMLYEDDDETVGSAGFAVGMVVEVMPRLWPGMNKQGGAARITKVHYNAGKCDPLLSMFVIPLCEFD